MLTLLTLLACAENAPVAAAPPPSRIVAVGDLHGDFDNAVATLKLAGLVDDGGKWVGGNTTLVQTGDTTDRGPDSKHVMDLLIRLETEALPAGGKVVAFAGNHEAMNMLGDLRYVNPEDPAAFGGEEARKAAFAPDGAYGAWLIDHGVTAKIGDVVFVHGGITPEWATRGVDGINADARAALRALDTKAPVLGNTGPLWYRDFVNDPEAQACPTLARSLELLDAERMVVGHTTRKDGRIEARCDGRLLVIDIGISDHYGANLGALELVGGDARAIYPAGPIDLPDPP